MITSYIQHPLPVKKLIHTKPADPIPLFLTEKERKKARRMKKRARLEIQAERVRLGLEEPPDPRVSLANVMRVLGNTAVADPSAVERQVRAKVEKRRLKHLLHNELRKLAPAERRQKKRRKAAENLSDGVVVAAFAVASLKSGRVRFKIDVSAQQLGLTGCALIYLSGKEGKEKRGEELGGAIVVEGGPNGVRKFKRLVLRRIDWAEENGGEGLGAGEESTDNEGEDEDRNRGCCRCVWEVFLQMF